MPGGTSNVHRVSWYRVPVGRDVLARLSARSDLLGAAQTLGHLGVLAATATVAMLAAGPWQWPLAALIAIVFVHGMCWNFLINGFHELIHETVFRTRWLNGFFLRIFSFLGWYNHHLFRASHTEHHRHTLHAPQDLEVVLPVRLSRADFLASGFLNLRGFAQVLRNHLRHAVGRLDGPWEHALFDGEPGRAGAMFRWSRIVLGGHALICALALWLHAGMLVVLVPLASFYGGWLFYLCNNTQHVGLRDHADDFRQCCRTIHLAAPVRFLYWHMNYHTEHHMYPAVPCYRLGRLHELLRPDLPRPPRGLLATWRHIAWVVERQRLDPHWQYSPACPPRRGSADVAS